MNISAPLPPVNPGSAEEDEEGVADGPFAAEVGRAVDDPAADDHGRRAAAVHVDGLDRPEFDEEGGELSKGHADAQLRLTAVHRYEENAAVGADPDGRPRMTRRRSPSWR